MKLSATVYQIVPTVAHTFTHEKYKRLRRQRKSDILNPNFMDTILFIRVHAPRPTYQERLSGVMDYAHERGWRVQTVDSPDGDKIASLLDLWHPRGVIIESGSGTNHYPASLFSRLPVVYLDRDWKTLSYTKGRIGCVEHDPVSTARAAAKELLSLDCAAYAFVPNFVPISWSDSRERAFRAVLELHGKSLSRFRFRQSVEDHATWHANLRRFLKGLPKPCGVFAANDPVAETVLVACADIGCSVPDDIAVVGVDDHAAICENTMPTLSSVALDFTGAGRISARLLKELIHSPSETPSVRTFGVLGLTRRASTRRLLRSDSDVSKALEMIRVKACEGLRARDVLNGMECSRRLAELRFRSATGQSPLEAIHLRRLECAREMLANTERTVEAIANMCGYGSAVFLQKLFRQHLGTTPSEWRKQNRR